MSKEAVFTMKLEPELRAEFMAEAEAVHRPASQVLRELMREFVLRQRESREYDDFLSRKVDAGRASMRAGVGHPNDEVEAVAWMGFLAMRPPGWPITRSWGDQERFKEPAS